MLVHQRYLTQHHPAILAHVLGRVPDYREPEMSPRLMTWHVQGYENLVLMQGGKVYKHDDGIEAYQPMLILRNPRGAWSFRGPNQPVRSMEPQTPGSLVVLDIGKKHLVSGRCPETWLALCWNPGRSVPKKSDYTLSEVINNTGKTIQSILTACS